MPWDFPFEILALGNTILLYLAWTSRLLNPHFFPWRILYFLESLQYYLKERFAKYLDCPISLLKCITLDFSTPKKKNLHSFDYPTSLSKLQFSIRQSKRYELWWGEDSGSRKNVIWALSWGISLKKNLDGLSCWPQKEKGKWGQEYRENPARLVVHLRKQSPVGVVCSRVEGLQSCS